MDVAFTAGGTHAGAEPDVPARSTHTVAERIAAGVIVQAGAFDQATGTVLGGGMHVPRMPLGVAEPD